MSYTKEKYSKIFKNYDPKDQKNHGIIRFLAEEFSEEEKVELIEVILNKGSWILATEITKETNIQKINIYAEKRFLEILNNWVTERIDHSKTMSIGVRNPYIPQRYIQDFKEVIFALRNLNFPNNLMEILERFFIQCNTSYLKRYFESNFWLVIEEFTIQEIEVFTEYYIKGYLKNDSINISNFLYSFMNDLSYSYKIFNFSENFNKTLNDLLNKLKNNNLKENYFFLINTLLVEFLIKKELNLSKSSYINQIDDTINSLEKGSPENLLLFRFLKRFKYSSRSYDFIDEIDFFINRFQEQIDKANNSGINIKRSIIHHFIKTSETYFELFLYYLENIEIDKTTVYLEKFIDIIDLLRNSFNDLLWYKEFLNFEIIEGTYSESVSGGYYIKIDDTFFNDRIQEKDLEKYLLDDNFVEMNSNGFLNDYSIKNNLELFKHFQSLASKKNKEVTYLLNNKNITLKYIIKNINYSQTNKGCVITLLPYNEQLTNKILKYQLKSFFPSIELFLLEVANAYLNITPILFKNSSIINSSFSKFKNDYNISFEEEKFWHVLQNKRPNIYQNTYSEIKTNENIFQKLIKIFENDKEISGTIESITNGGLFVNVLGYKAFLPGSHLDIKPVDDYSSYIGKSLDFRIIKIYEEFKSVVVSHRIVLEPQLELEKERLRKEIKIGQKVIGYVKNITSYGVFISFGTLDGLIHITDLSWSRIKYPSEIVTLNQEIEVVILNFDKNKTKIELGLKQLNEDPWTKIEGVYEVGQKIMGKIVQIMEYGAFLEIQKGVEALLHVSEISWSTYCKVKDFFKIGDTVNVIITTFNISERKMSVSKKQLTKDPWITVSKQYPINSIHKGKVIKILPRAIIIELELGIVGFLKMQKKSIENIKEGEFIKVRILRIDNQKRMLTVIRIIFEEKRSRVIKKGDIIKGKLLYSNPKGYTIKIENGQIGFCFSSNLKQRNGEFLLQGDEAYFKIIKYSTVDKRIIISHKHTYI